MRSSWHAALASPLLVLAVSTASVAHADRCAPIAGGSIALGRKDSRERIAFMRASVARASPRARLWAELWAVGLGALAAGSILAVPLVDEDDRVDLWIGALSSVLGMIPLAIAPLEVLREPRAINRAIGSGRDSCETVARAEARFVEDADSDAAGVAWWGHGLNVAVNAALFLVLGLGFGHWTAGAISGGTGLVIGEAFILTQPTGALDALERYRTGAW